MQATSRRSGFTLFQLLVVIIILALLLAMLIPAIGKVRTAASRLQSASNLKQLALAVHNYLSTFGKLPPGVNKLGYSTTALLLPFIEQENLYRQIDFMKPVDDRANAALRKIVIAVLISRLDEAKPLPESGPTNYLFNAGSQPSLTGNNGVFFAGDFVNFTNINDGTSNTVMAAETLRGNGVVKAETPLRQHVALKAEALKDIKPEAGVADWKGDKNIAADRGGAWIEGKFLQGTFTATLGVNDDRPDVTCGGEGGLSGIRTMGNGFNVAMCDGSVRFIAKDVKFATWQSACTRNGGEVLGNDF